jgi:hypothetical protein
MGALYAGVCYPSLPGAQAEFCSSWHQSFSTASSVTELRCGVPAATWFDIHQYVNGSRQAQILTGTYPEFPSCDYDGGAVVASEWAAVGFSVLVVIWGIKKLNSLFEVPHERE